MNIVKALLADTTTGSNHGTSSNSDYRIWCNNSNLHGRGFSMNYLDLLLTLLRWKNTGWEVHPINLDSEFQGWI